MNSQIENYLSFLTSSLTFGYTIGRHDEYYYWQDGNQKTILLKRKVFNDKIISPWIIKELSQMCAITLKLSKSLIMDWIEEQIKIFEESGKMY